MKWSLAALFPLAALVSHAEDPIRPDSKLTPGAIFPYVTVEEITKKGYAKKLHGGGSNAPKNLWTESYYTVPFNAHVKDALEDRLAANVRHGHDAATTLLKQYQHEIAKDWIAAYHKYVAK